jgi:hypothetical protein
MPDRRLYDSPDIRHPDQAFLCVSGDAGRAVVLRIEPPVASRPFGLPSLTPSRLLALRAALAKSGEWRWWGGWLAVPFTVSRRSHRQGLRVLCTLAAWRPSVEP